MPSFGGLTPFPVRFGGGKPALETHVKSMLAQLGTALDTTDTNGLVYVRAQAYARVVWALWEQNQRLANQWDPSRMTDFLGRWENILRLPVSPSDSLSVRRARVAVSFSRVGEGNWNAVYSACKAYLGSTFVGIITTPSGSANIYTPTGWPMGTNEPAGSATPPDWYSTVAHIDIATTQPSTMGDDEFYATRASVIPALDAILPAWVTFSIIRDGAHGAGFFLDEAHNLDNERLRV